MSLLVLPTAAASTPSTFSEDSARPFKYSRASPAVRWPDLESTQQDSSPPPSLTLTKLPVTHLTPQPHPNPYIAAKDEAFYSPHAASRQRRLSKLALKKARDWKQRAERLAAAILQLGPSQSVADLVDAWKEQLAPSDMGYAVKIIGATSWPRALELYELLNLTRWYRPNSRMLATMLSILGRANQTPLAEELYQRAEPSLDACVQVYNAMMSVYARQGNWTKVQHLLEAMSSKGCNPDLVTFNIVINTRAKVGLQPGMACQLLKDIVKAGLTPDVITYNTLISACNSAANVSEATEIFEEMKHYGCEPDIWTYNGMISAYGRAGKIESAKELFEVMQEKGFVPDAITYNSLLYAFAKYARVEDVGRVKTQMSVAKCKPDEITYNTMISMYGKMGLHDRAFSLYHEMKNDGCQPDAITFTVLIDALGKAGLASEAQKIFSEMGEVGIKPTLQTFSAMICSYAKVGMFMQAEHIYDCMQKTGIPPDYLAYSLMLDLFQKFNLPKKAMSIYESMLDSGFKPKLDTYKGLLSLFANEGMELEAEKLCLDLQRFDFAPGEVCDVLLKAGLHDKAAKFLTSAAADGFLPSNQIVVNVLIAFITSNSFDDARIFVESLSRSIPNVGSSIRQNLIIMLAEAKQLTAAKDELNELQRLGQRPKFETCKTLIVCFDRMGMLDETLEILSDLQCLDMQLDAECCKIAVATYCKLGLPESAHELVSSETVFSPKELFDIYINLIEAYGNKKLWEKAELTFKEMRRMGLTNSLRAWNALISAYAVCGQYQHAKLALYEMVKSGKAPTESICNAILEALINSRQLKDMYALLQELRQLGASPSKHTFLFVLNAAAKNDNVDAVKLVYQEMKRAGYLPNMQVYTTLILSLSRQGLVQDCESVLLDMKSDNFTPDIKIYNAMLYAYSKRRSYRQAVDVFQGMQAAGCQPDKDTFNCLLWLYSRHLKIQEAISLLRQMRKAGCSPDIESYTALISTCGRLNLVEAAEILFKDMLETQSSLKISAFHAMMKVYRCVGKHAQAQEILNVMKNSGIQPTLGTFHLLMDSYGKGGEPGTAEVILERMQEIGITPGTMQLTSLVDAYLKSKKYDLAIEKLLIMNNNGLKPDYTTWTSLVAAASHCESRSQVLELLSALRDVGFDLPLRLFTERNEKVLMEFKDLLVKLKTFGLDAGLGLVNVLVDLLWGFQLRAMAAKVFYLAIQEDIYPRSMARVQDNDWRADFRRLSAGGALVALTLWLDQMQGAALKGFPESSKSVLLVTGNSQYAHRASVGKTVKVYLWSMGSPFLVSKTRPGVLIAKGHSLRHWLRDSPHCTDLELKDFPTIVDANSMKAHNGAWMPAKLVPALEEITERLGEVRPKKFSKLVNMSDIKRTNTITAEIKGKQEMLEKGKVKIKQSNKSFSPKGRWRYYHSY